MEDKKFIADIRKAIKANDVETVVKLVGDSKERLNTVFVFGSWLHEAAGLGHIELAEKLLDMGIDTEIEAFSYKGSAIASAATKGQIEMIRYLLSRGMKLDVSNTDGNPLFCAIVRGHVDTVKFLIEAGIDVNVNYAEEGNEPWTALELAKQYGNEKIINLIKRASSSCDGEDCESDNISQIENFIEKEIGEVDATIEGIPLIQNIKMNIHIIQPYESNSYKLLMTDGMSNIQLYDNKYTELMVRIPSFWADELLKNQRDESTEVHWIFKWIIYLSYIPHKHNTTIVNGLPCPTSVPPKPIFNGTEMTSFVYAYPVETNWRNIQYKEKDISIFEIISLYEEEYQLALEKRGEYIINLFDNNMTSRVINWNRKKLI